MPRRFRHLAAVATITLAGAAMSLGAIGARVASLAAGIDTLPTTDKAPVYDSFQAVSDPGKGAADYFKPYWYSNTIQTGPTAGKGAHHIQAHGGQIVPVKENGTTVYYWYGESHENGYGNSPGVHCYRSTDLYNWEDKGIVLRTVSSLSQLRDPSNKDYAYFHELYGTESEKVARYLLTNGDSNGDGKADQLAAIIERPKMLHNEKTGKWVLWFHSDGSTTVGGGNYSRAMLGVATSDSPTGPFKLVGAYKGFDDNGKLDASWGELGDSRDMTAYAASDGNAYVGYSSEGNTKTYVAKLDDTWTHLSKMTGTDESKSGMQYSSDGKYTDITGGKEGVDFKVINSARREAVSFMEFGGRTYAITSPTNGWDPGLQNWYYSDNGMLGDWKGGSRLTRGLDSEEGTADGRGTTFGSQIASVLPYDAERGEFIYVGDRWDAGKADSTYVFLPIIIRSNKDLAMSNPGKWDLGYWKWNNVSHSVQQQEDAGQDASAGIYVGGNMRATTYEIEGVSIVNGNAELPAGGFNRDGGSLGGYTVWGLGYSGNRDADVMNVGGNLTHSVVSSNGKDDAKYFSASGSIKIGGTVEAGYSVLKPSDAIAHGFNSAFANDQARDPQTGIGKAKALIVNLGGGRTYDFTSYASTVSSMSDGIASLKDSGTVSFSQGSDTTIRVPKNWGKPYDPWQWSITHAGLVTLRGSGTGKYQAFTLDTDAMAREAQAKGYKVWSFAFDNIPDDVPIYVNVKGKAPSFSVSQGYYLNGRWVGINTNDLLGDKKAFTNLAGRLIWNFDDSDSFHLVDPYDVAPKPIAPEKNLIGGANKDDKPVTRWAVNFPGSIIMKRGNAQFDVDTNGRIYVNGNLSVESSEHHNTPFRFSIPSASISIEKYDVENGDDSKSGDRDTEAEAYQVPRGQDSARIRFDIKNTGSQTLNDVTVDDTVLTGTGKLSDITYPTHTIPVGGSITVTATVTGIGAEHGAHADSAIATGIGADTGDKVESSPDEWHAVASKAQSLPALDIVKAYKVKGHESDAAYKAVAGDVISYTAKVTNTGNIALAPVTVTDDLLGVKDRKVADSLEPGQSVDVPNLGEHTVTQADLDASDHVDNTVSAHGVPPKGVTPPKDPTSSVSTPLGGNPGISVKKTASLGTDINGNGRYDTGDTVRYAIQVKNTGSLTLSDVTIDDALLGVKGLPVSAKLSPGSSADVPDASVPKHVITADEAKAGYVDNTVSATGTPSRGTKPVGTDKVRVSVVAPVPATSVREHVAVNGQNPRNDQLAHDKQAREPVAVNGQNPTLLQTGDMMGRTMPVALAVAAIPMSAMVIIRMRKKQR